MDKLLQRKNLQEMGTGPIIPLPPNQGKESRPIQMGNIDHHRHVARIPTNVGKSEQQPTWTRRQRRIIESEREASQNDKIPVRTEGIDQPQRQTSIPQTCQNMGK
jgi:hypothetical protein